MKFPFRLLLTTASVLIAIYVLPGIWADDFLPRISAALAIAFANTVPKRVLLKLKVPMNMMVFGLIILTLNILTTYLAAYIIPGFHTGKVYYVIFFSIILTGITSVMNSIIPSEKIDEKHQENNLK
jgi:putative membrane protein